MLKAKREAVRKWIVSQFGQFLNQLPKWKGCVFRCAVACVLEWTEILQVGPGLSAEVSCRAVLGACTSALGGLAESTAKPGRGRALSWSWPAELGPLLGDYSEEPARWFLTGSVGVQPALYRTTNSLKIRGRKP